MEKLTAKFENSPRTRDNSGLIPNFSSKASSDMEHGDDLLVGSRSLSLSMGQVDGSAPAANLALGTLFCPSAIKAMATSLLLLAWASDASEKEANSPRLLRKDSFSPICEEGPPRTDSPAMMDTSIIVIASSSSQRSATRIDSDVTI